MHKLIGFVGAVALAGCSVPCDLDGSCGAEPVPLPEERPSPAPQYYWHGDLGPCTPERMTGASGSRSSAGCGGGGTCEAEYWTFSPAVPAATATACEFQLSTHGGAVSSAVLSPEDCQALQCWLTSEVLASGASRGCVPSLDRSDMEDVQVSLSDQESRGVKFGGCSEEPFVSHRNLVKAVLAKYFP